MSAEWRVYENISPRNLAINLNSLTQEGFDIYQIDFIAPFVDSSRSYLLNMDGNYYNIIGVKY